MAANTPDRVLPAGTEVERISPAELRVRRVFRASPAIVFDAMTRPELLRRWWAPRSLGVVLHECEAEVRVGGRYRYVFGKAGAPAMAFSGVYREVVPGRRLVYTQLFEPMPEAGEGVITAIFEVVPGGTLLTQTECYPSEQVLDAVLASGMEKGMRETLEQLAVLVVELEVKA